MTSGRHSRRGLELFSLTEGATRRGGWQGALIRHRQRQRRPPIGATVDEQNEYLLWVCAWEEAIIDYRDGNKGEHDD